MELAFSGFCDEGKVHQLGTKLKPWVGTQDIGFKGRDVVIVLPDTQVFLVEDTSTREAFTPISFSSSRYTLPAWLFGASLFGLERLATGMPPPSALSTARVEEIKFKQ